MLQHAPNLVQEINTFLGEFLFVYLKPISVNAFEGSSTFLKKNDWWCNVRAYTCVHENMKYSGKCMSS